MWPRLIGKFTSYLLTISFVAVFAAMLAGIAFVSFFLVEQIAFAAPVLDDGSKVCIGCHGNENFAANVNGQKISLYVDQNKILSSVHNSISCQTCHRGTAQIPHENIAYGNDLKRNTQEACLSCHNSLKEEYQNSIHGRMAQTTDQGFCTDCHGSAHEIIPVSDSNSPVIKANVVETCQKCHDGIVAESYNRSFHGIALKFGKEDTASCVDCHSSHGILLSGDPNSQVSKENLPATCVSCHGGETSANWANGIEHTTFEDKERSFPLWITWKIFLVLILVDIIKDLPIIIFELIKQFKTATIAKKNSLSDKGNLKA